MGLHRLALACAVFAAVWLAAPASALEPHAGIGVVWSVDLCESTVTIGREIYRVTPETELSDARGERLAMLEIPVARSDAGGLRGMRQAAVRFEARGERGNLFLASLRLMPD